MVDKICSSFEQMAYLQHPVDHNLHKLSHDSIRVVKDLYHLIMNLQ